MKKLLVFAILIVTIGIGICLAAENAEKKDDVVTRICKRNPSYSFCKQYMEGEMGEASMIPFPHGHKHVEESKEASKSSEKRLLIIENEFYPNGTVKIPPNVTLDASNEAELAKIKKVNPKPWQPSNNWGFGEAPPLPAGVPLLGDPNRAKGTVVPGKTPVRPTD